MKDKQTKDLARAVSAIYDTAKQLKADPVVVGSALLTIALYFFETAGVPEKEIMQAMKSSRKPPKSKEPAGFLN